MGWRKTISYQHHDNFFSLKSSWIRPVGYPYGAQLLLLLGISLECRAHLALLLVTDVE